MINWKKYYNSFVAITSIHAVAYTAYKLYVHYRDNKLNYIDSDDFTAKDTVAYKTFDFTHHMDKMVLLKFENIQDNLGQAQAAFFEYRKVIFTLAHYTDDEKNHYTLWLDVKSCEENKKDATIISEKFIEAIGFQDVPVVWFNKDWDKLLGKNE